MPEPRSSKDTAGRIGSVGPRLIAGTLLALGSVLLLSGIITVIQERHALYEQIDAQGASVCEAASLACVEALLIEDYPVLETYAELLVKNNEQIVSAQIERADGQVVASFPSSAAHDGDAGRDRVRRYQHLIAFGPDNRSLGQIVIGVSTYRADRRVHYQIAAGVLNIAVTFALVTTLLVFLLRRVVSQPLARLDRQARALGHGALDVPIRAGRPDEIGRLAQTLDTMRRNLKDSYEAIQRQNEELMKVDRLKDEFLANMTHELRTPMNAIMGFSEILAEEDLPNAPKKYAGLIFQASQNLLDIINDILDFSKISCGKLELEITDCVLQDLLNNAELMFRAAATEKGLDFQIRQHRGLSERMQTDPTRVRQCLLNLVGNAIKFTKRGHVYLDIRPTEADGIACIRFDVEDTGIGIPPEKKGKIFESFTQADGSHTRKYGGTGLGLTITRSLARLLGGNLTVESQVGVGSVFTLIIPVEHVSTTNASSKVSHPGKDDSETRNGAAPTDATKPVTSDDLSGRVLVAEDIPANRKLNQVVLERLGLDVVTVQDGQQAVKAAGSQRFDLILLDIQMPVMSGLTAAKTMRDAGIETPLIALTAHATQHDEQQCLQAGFDAYLTLPLDQDKLAETIRQMLQNEASKMASATSEA